MKRLSACLAAAVGIAVAVIPLFTTRIAAQPKPTGYADRLYILDGGLGRSHDAGSWWNEMVPPKTTVDIAAYAHLIKHGDTWMMFDTSTNDAYADLGPEGFAPGGGIQWIKTKAQTLAPQLKAIGVTPDQIRYIGISHNHADHTGNVEQFPKAEVLIQRREYEFMYAKGEGPTGPPNFKGPVMKKDHPHRLLDGDFDVFGDGSVVLYLTAGHTLGSQVAMVRLKNTGYVVLSGDAVHFRSNFDTRRIPRVGRANEENEWLWSVPLAFARIEKLMQHYKAQLWVHHDFEDYKGRKLAPQYYE